MSSLHEECGVFGIYANTEQDLARTVYYGLFQLQHRGQESCGIVVNHDGVFTDYKDNGLVSEVFTKSILKSLGTGNISVGHCRYGTTGTGSRLNAQPIVVNHHKGKMALAHNGNIVNAFELRNALEEEGAIFHTTSDTEVICYMIIKERLRNDSIEAAVNDVMNVLKGAYSLVVMSPSKLVAARDPMGFRPLCYGIREDGAYIVASESCALDAAGAEFVRDIDPGEVVVFGSEGVTSIRDHCGTMPKNMCIFEYLYFARPDSVIEGKSVHLARVKAGEILAKRHPVEADMVIGVPDSGLDAAIGYAKASGIPYGMGFIKNKYIGRTFIAPGQKNREDKVQLKLNVIDEAIRGKRIVLVDDSIVRGTTITRIVKILRKGGAKEVHVRSSAPPFTDPCYYGTDVDTKENLIACQVPFDEIASVVGADSVGYLPVEDLPAIIGLTKDEGFCSSCFTGTYPTQVPTGEKDRFEKPIHDSEAESQPDTRREEIRLN